MKELLLLRHAKSSWKNGHLADFERPLNKRGKRDAPRMGRLAASEDLTPDFIVTSSAKRALATAQSFADKSGYEAEIRATRLLYEAGAEEYVSVLQEAPDTAKRVMVVGHNPGLEEFLEELTGGYQRLPTAALAYVHLAIEKWSLLGLDGRGVLKGLWLSRELL